MIGFYRIRKTGRIRTGKSGIRIELIGKNGIKRVLIGRIEIKTVGGIVIRVRMDGGSRVVTENPVEIGKRRSHLIRLIEERSGGRDREEVREKRKRSQLKSIEI